MDMKLAMLSNIALKRIASGLSMMAVFTFFWASCAYYGLLDTSYRWLLLIFPILCVIFIYNAFRLIRKAQNLPSQPLADLDEEEKRGKRFGIILAGEGIGIFIAVNIVINLHHRELIMPAIALVVGLHFIPLAKLFKRKFDYYLGTWSILIAFFAITFSLNKMLNESAVLAFTGIGMAVSTTFYGLKMILSAHKALS
ncbi:hypothetical protein [Pedobacter sp. WC2423]|uniref:hypothetical protein n=1 Tax=Pedobacter sp. WC2423 TaxID=3234142 RepID=UPI0034661E0A